MATFGYGRQSGRIVTSPAMKAEIAGRQRERKGPPPIKLTDEERADKALELKRRRAGKSGRGGKRSYQPNQQQV